MDEDQDGGSELGAMFPTPVSKHRFLCNVVVSIVLAGKDTTSSTLTWLFWLLAANPRCELHVHEEARRGGVKGTMHYLHAALTEAMRLYPPVPFNGRVAAADEQRGVALQLLRVRDGADGNAVGRRLRGVRSGALAQRRR
jgi:hypothetical protein